MSGKFHNLLCFFGFRMWQTYLNDNDSECTPQVTPTKLCDNMASIDSLIYVRRRINKAMLVEFSRFDLPSRDESVDMRGGYESGGGRLISNCDRAIPNHPLILLLTISSSKLWSQDPIFSYSCSPAHNLKLHAFSHSHQKRRCGEFFWFQDTSNHLECE